MRIVLLDDARGDAAPPLDDGGDLLFERPLGHQLQDLHGAALADAVDAGSRSGRLPPFGTRGMLSSASLAPTLQVVGVIGSEVIP